MTVNADRYYHRLPGIAWTEHVRLWLYRIRSRRWKFTTYYRGPGWECPESKSGPGSTAKATRALRKALPDMLARYHVRSILDLGCGDFAWMRLVDLGSIRYTGIDIVRPLIEDNRKRYACDHIAFECRDSVCDPLPNADLVICRDFFIHYNFSSIRRILRNIRRCGALYLLATTHVQEARNLDLYAVGWFRPLNLQRAPFGFPDPLGVVVEEPDKGKCCGLWSLDAIAASAFLS